MQLIKNGPSKFAAKLVTAPCPCSCPQLFHFQLPPKKCLSISQFWTTQLDVAYISKLPVIRQCETKKSQGAYLKMDAGTFAISVIISRTHRSSRAPDLNVFPTDPQSL